jgi:hypothetical protein
MHDYKVLMTIDQGGKLCDLAPSGQINPHYKQKSWTVNVNSNNLLISYVCIMYITSRLQFFMFMAQ